MEASKKAFDIVFLDPLFLLFNSHRPNSPGIAFLRGYLEANGIRTDVVNLNREMDFSMREKFFHLVDLANGGNFFSTAFSCEACEDNLQTFYLKLNSTNNWEELEEMALFDYYFRDKLDTRFQASTIGISILDSRQIIFSILFSIYLKKKKKNTKIVMGGPALTTNYRDFLELFSESPIVDYFILGEGETPLYMLVKGYEKSQIPNLVFFDKGVYKFSEKQGVYEDLDQLPAPVYQSGDFHVLQASRGCYWNKCTFCVFIESQSARNDFSRCVRHKSTSKLVSDVKECLSTNTDFGKFFFFADNELNLKFLASFARQIRNEKEIDCIFGGYLRAEEWVDYSLLQSARMAGFTLFDIGVESFIPRLRNDILNKGYSQERILKIIDYCYELGIRLRIQIIIGIPSQTRDELLQECKFISYLGHKYDNIFFNVKPFGLSVNSIIYHHPKRFGVELLSTSRKFCQPFVSFRQIDDKAVSPREADRIYNNFASESRVLRLSRFVYRE